MAVRNGSPWANPTCAAIVEFPLKYHAAEWQCTIDQSYYQNQNDISFFQYPGNAFPDIYTVALFRVRRKILHGYTVRDCNLSAGIDSDMFGKVSESVISQVRHNSKEHLTNYAYPVQWWTFYHETCDSHTIAIFRVKRRVNNGS